MSAETLEWVTINDFKPGIAQVPGIHHALGTAVEDGTYGCIANESGALVPTPSVSRTITAEPPLDDPTNLMSRFWIAGFGCFGPLVRDDGGYTVGEERNNAELWFGFEWFRDDAGTPYRDREVHRYLRAYDTPIWEEIAADSIVDDTNANTQGLLPTLCTFGFTTANITDPTQSGLPIITFCFDRLTHYFPDFDTPGTNSIGTIPRPPDGDPQPFRHICHQGRVVVFPLNIWQHGGQNAVYVNAEGFYWMNVNDPETRSDITGSEMGYFDGRFQGEQPTGWRSPASLTANELFLLKGKGGAVVIRGDLDDPTVIRLPNVQDVGQAQCDGANSPIGFVYPTDAGGVWVWSGGDTSTHISRQMLPDFWKPTTDEDYFYPFSNCTLWREWVVTPNGWMLDTDRLGWWKYTDPDTPTFNWHDTDWTGRWLYATPIDFTIDDPTVCYEFDRRRPRNDFSWKSHPMMSTIGRQVQARELILSASGHGEVVVTVSTRDGQQSERQFRVDNDFPEAIRKDVSVSGSHLQIKIFSHGDEGEPAPTVYEVRMGLHARARIDRGSNG